MEIDPRLREPSPYNPLPSYALNPIRLPPPQQPFPPLPQDAAHPYYSLRQDPQPRKLPPPEISLRHDPSVPSSQLAEDSPTDPKRPRACEACRGLKVRCEPDPIKGTCRRCAKAGRHCVVTAPSRKRQKKTDSRVAELEKKIDALTASLQATTKGQGTSDSDDDSYEEPPQPQSISTNRYLDVSQNSARQGPDSSDSTPYSKQRSRPSSEVARQQPIYPAHPGASRKRRRSEYQDDDTGAVVPASRPDPPRYTYLGNPSPHIVSDTSSIHPHLVGKRVNSRTSRTSTLTPPDAPIPGHEYADVVDRKILDATTAANIFYHYINEMAPHMPTVVFPLNTQPGEIRRTKPTLFLAILSIASGQDHPELQRILTKDVMRIYGERIVSKGEKSLELIQALQISTIWYWPEDDKDAKYYQLIHMAAVMAIDLGLARKAKVTKERYHGVWRDETRTKSILPTPDTIESRRAWLSCFLLCANTAMGLRRPNIIRWSSYMDECLNVLETSNEALASDMVLCQWLRLQRLTDEVGGQISMDDAYSVGVADPKIQYALKGFERQLKDWQKQKPRNIVSLPLDFGLNVVNLYMHEVAMHLEYNMESLKTPYNRDDARGNGNTQPEILTSGQVGALTICLTSIHGVLDTFLAFTVKDVRTVPIFHFVRMAYANVLLMKMYFAATSRDSELGKVISIEDMKLEQYLSRTIDSLRAGSADGKCRPAHNFLMVLVMLKTLFERQREGKCGVSDEIAKGVQFEAQPVGSERNTPRQGYRKIQLNGDGHGAGPTSIPQEPLAPLPPLPAMGNTPLHMLSEVAMGGSAASGHQISNGGDGWYNYNANAMGTAINHFSTGYYPPTMQGIDAGVDHNTHQGMYPGFEQAIGMTFGEGDLSASMFMGDGFFDMMQETPNVFQHMG